MQRNDSLFELIGKVRAPFRLALAIRLMLDIERVAHVIDARQHRSENFAVADHAADGDAAEADAVIGALAANEDIAMAFAFRAPIRERHLERGIDSLRT